MLKRRHNITNMIIWPVGDWQVHLKYIKKKEKRRGEKSVIQSKY